MMEPKSRRGPASPIMQIAIDPQSDVPMYRQVYDGLREAILSGRVAKGGRLPSSRALASDLGVARNTVLQAFEQLRSEGYLAGQRGGGTRTKTVPDAFTTLRRPERVTRARNATPLVLSKRGAKIVSEVAGFYRNSDFAARPFEIGVPAADVFPTRVWGKIAARRWRQGSYDLGDADGAGDPALREAIAAYVTASRGARCTGDQVFVVNGAQQAAHLIAHVLLDPGDRAWLEDPGYVGARSALAVAGAKLVPVPVDEEGLIVAAGIKKAKDARLAYVTPSHQMPLGAVMSAPRRMQLLAWARESGAWIVEDDYDSEFRYSGRPLPCLQGLDSDARVLYVGTFSKTLFSGLRLGYMVVPDGLIDVFRAARAALDRHSTTLHQGVLAEFIAEGHYARHIRRARALCAERQATLLDAASIRLEGLLTLAPDAAGLHLVGQLPDGVHDVDAARAANDAGIRTVPLSRFSLHARAGDGLVLGYAGYDEKQIRGGVDQLARTLKPLRPLRPLKPIASSRRS